VITLLIDFSNTWFHPKGYKLYNQCANSKKTNPLIVMLSVRELGNHFYNIINLSEVGHKWIEQYCLLYAAGTIPYSVA